MHTDEDYMRQAIELAQNAPDRPFGALLVHKETGEIVGKGWNQTKEKNNPASHGEMEAIIDCVEKHRPQKDYWRDLVLYTTAEPCAMCQSTVFWAGIGKVVFGSSLPFLQGLDDWRQSIDIRAEEVLQRTRNDKGEHVDECEIKGGVLEKECNELFIRATQLAQTK